ncbi:MAG: MarR family transcriptional regulator [Bacillota bacterium]|nr:MarR family transcriptional regulator [Bacillota bacterium]
MRRERPGVGMAIAAVTHSIKRQIPKDFLGCDVELTGTQIWVLVYIASLGRDGAVFQRDVETAFNITRSTASGILKRLEEKGFLIRRTDRSDSRQRQLFLTPRAVDLCAAMTQAVSAIDEKLLRGIEPRELETFLSVLGRMCENINS